MAICYFDSETCGLAGVPILLQLAWGDGPVILHELWREPIGETLELIEGMVNNEDGIVGFNLVFDVFHLQKIYNMFSLFVQRNGIDSLDAIPKDYIEEMALLEADARDGKCLKFVKACDLMLIARRGVYQSTMNRKNIVVRKVPTVIAQDLADLLEKEIELSDIYFSRKKVKSTKWSIRPCPLKDNPSKFEKDFQDVVLSFRASAALKVIANDLLGKNRYSRDRSVFQDIAIDKQFVPGEAPFAPFATAISSPEDNWRIPKDFFVKDIRGKQSWPALVKKHISHWAFSTPARIYATDDVLDTRAIYYKFGTPPLGDTDSTLACMVASCRWRGYTIDVDGLKAKMQEVRKVARSAPRSAREAKEYISALMEPVEIVTFTTTKKMVLEKMARTMMTDCPTCKGDPNPVNPCKTCNNSGEIIHPCVERVKNVLAARAAKMELDTYAKLITAGRFHASFNVIGTLSGRMSGTDRFNPQAIKASGDLRSYFTLAQPGYILCGGDFTSFEVAIAEANYNDPKLRETLLSKTQCYKCHGNNPNCDDCQGTNQTPVKIHALFGTICYPNMTYEEIVKNKVIYTRSKSGFFAKIYGGNYYTLMSKLDVDEKAALDAEARFEATYPGVRKARLKVESMFQSMRQPDGIGTKVEWHEPVDKMPNMLNPPFCRYFTLENAICKALFKISNKPPKEWAKYKNVKVWRRDRQQNAVGSVQSALYGSAFMIQAANTRAAANHEIQSTGSEITKDLQVQLWGLQPVGINEWKMQTFNVHDEVNCSVKKGEGLEEKILKIIDGVIEKYKPLIPLIGIYWKNGMESWGSK